MKNHAIVKHGWNTDTKSPATDEDVKTELKKEEKAEEEIGPVTLSDDSDDGNKRKPSAASLLDKDEPAQTAKERTGWTTEAIPQLEAGNPCVRKKLEMASPKSTTYI